LKEIISLNVSSFGDTIEDAKKSVKEAIEAFVEACERMVRLEDCTNLT